MSLTTRQLTNQGAPLYAPDGTVLANTSITFTIVDEYSLPTDAFDVLSGSRVVGVSRAVTNGSGEFSINLWPNNRGDKLTRYLCQCPGSKDFVSQVPEGAGILTWLNFKTSGAVLSPTEITALDAHIGDAVLHLTPSQNVLLDALDSNITSEELNCLDGVTSPIQTQLNALMMDKVNTVSITASTGTILEAHDYVGVNYAGTVALTLTTVNNKRVSIKDESGLAGTNNITITPSSGTIDGQTTAIMNLNWMSLTLVCRNGNWFVA